MSINRRRFIAGSAAAASLALPFVGLRAASPRYGKYPFSLGVASGCPSADGVVLWTRLAPEPLDGGGMAAAPVEVDWEIAEDDRFGRIVQRVTARATPEEAHSVHVELRGLKPHRWYWYRFSSGDAVSPIGRTRTAAAAGDMSPLRLAFGACQQYEQGYYGAYRHMLREDIDLMVHLGDYIYEMSWGVNHVRKHGIGVPTSLPEFRDRYALYKSDRDLQAAHAAFPWLITWDDHEVANDYAGDRSPGQSNTDFFMRMRAAAYRAFWEHLPLPLSAKPQGPNATIYGGYRFGALADIVVLDDRQYRDHQVCSPTGGPIVGECAQRHLPERTMLGAAQEQWFAQRMGQRNGRWTIVAQQTLMAQADRSNKSPTPVYWTDGWDGYPAARQRLIDAMVDNRASNPLVIGGDVHSFWAADLKRDFNRPDSEIVASELVGSSITSQGPAWATAQRMMAKNPHLKFARNDKRGYVAMDITKDHAVATFRAVDDVTKPDTGIADLARFTIENGRPGPQQG